MSRKGCKDLKPRKKKGGYKRVSQTAETKARVKVTRLRAGRRKCSRCKVVWNKPRGVIKTICPRCREHCSRCDVLLTEENKWKSAKGTHTYMCKPCQDERFVLDGKAASHRDYTLVNTYGITANEYEKILKNQNGACWICEKPPKEGGNRLAVDHLHSKGERKRNPRDKRARVRGLLCWACNASLGKFSDSVTKLRRAADYLEAWPAQQVLKEK